MSQTDDNVAVPTITLESITIVGQEYRNVTVSRSFYITHPEVMALTARTEEGEPLASFSVNLPESTPNPGCIWVKTWSEGEGNLEQLEKLGVLQRTGRKRLAGFSVAVEARLLGELANVDS